MNENKKHTKSKNLSNLKLLSGYMNESKICLYKKNYSINNRMINLIDILKSKL